MKKDLIIFITAIFIGTALLPGIKAKDAVQPLTKDQAVTLATENNINALKINTAINTINRNIKKYEELKLEVIALEKGFQTYKVTYNSLSASEVAIYNLFNETEPSKRTETVTAVLKSYGYSDGQIALTLGKLTALNAAGTQLKEAGLTDSSLKPKELTKAQQYEKFVYPREIPVVIAKNMLKKAELQKSTINCTIDVKVKEGYDAVLYGEEGYNLTEQLYEKLLKDFAQTESKYTVGVISQTDRNIGEIQLKKSKLKLDNLQRDLKNGKINFNQSLGTNIQTEYSFNDDKEKASTLKNYNSYLSSAIGSRGEILASNIDIDEKLFIFNLIKDYYSEGEYEYKKAVQELNEAKIKHSEAEKAVEEDIKNLYLDVQERQGDISLANKKLDQAKVQHISVKASYDAGMMPIAMVWNVDLLVNQCEMNLAKAQRDYCNALYNLEQNSKVGTKYVMEGAN